MRVPGIKVIDANVWLALAFRDHVHHQRACQWFDAQAPQSCAFCRVTQFSLLRHLTNAKIMGQFVQGQQQAWQQYDRLVADHRILFLAEPSTAEAEFRKLTQSSHPRHSMWSDAYLAALAIVNSAAVSTFDRDFQKFPGLNVELIALSP